MFKPLVLPKKEDPIHLTQSHSQYGIGSPFLTEFRGDDGRVYMAYSIVVESVAQQIVYLTLSAEFIPERIPITTWDDKDQPETYLYNLDELKRLNS